MGEIKRIPEEILACDTSRHNNGKHNYTPSQINIKPHTKRIFTSDIFIHYIMFRFHLKKKKKRHTEGQKTKFEETEEASEPDKDMSECWYYQTRNLK